MLDSQTSDEIYKVVNDFYQRQHRIIRDRDSMTDDEASLGLYQTPSDEAAAASGYDMLMESGDIPENLIHADWLARNLIGDASSIVGVHRVPH